MTAPLKNSPADKVSTTPSMAGRVGIKAVVLFVIFNLIFVLLDPIPQLGKSSAYNTFIPGRQRLPYGDNPKIAYNISLYTLSAMFASHELAGAAISPSEYRVLIIGDSATWGFLLPTYQTISSLINQENYSLPDGRRIKTYNLGYPVMSLTKDLLILSEAMRFQPDMIIWPVTLESFPKDKQLFPPLLQNNARMVGELIREHNLSLDPSSAELIQRSLLQRTIIGARRDLADLAWLQLYGVMWAATGVDQDIPKTYTLRQDDLTDDVTFHDLSSTEFGSPSLAMDVLQAGIKIAGDTPILLVNEPMFISQGKNSDLRYNFFYPRWAYDDYRAILQTFSTTHQLDYLDLWNFIPAQEFTNSAVHLTPEGNLQYAQRLLKAITEIAK